MNATHPAQPTPGPGACFCLVCGEPVRTADGGRFAVHADPRTPATGPEPDPWTISPLGTIRGDDAPPSWALPPVVVVIVRHPDSETMYAAHTPDGRPVRFVEADLGSSFDGRPHGADEADTAREIAARLAAGVDDIPDGPARRLALGWAESLLDDAAPWPEDPDA